MSQVCEENVPQKSLLCSKEVIVAIRDNGLRCFYGTEKVKRLLELLFKKLLEDSYSLELT